MTTDDPYRVLGVPMAASQSEVRDAFRATARRLHPDGRQTDQVDGAAMAALIDAWRILGDPEARAEFDVCTAASGDPSRIASSRITAAPRIESSYSPRLVRVLFTATLAVVVVIVIVFTIIAFAQSG